MSKPQLIGVLRVCTALMFLASLLALIVARNMPLGAICLALAALVRQNELAIRVGQLEKRETEEGGTQGASAQPNSGPSH
jgi:hypothetical protein